MRPLMTPDLHTHTLTYTHTHTHTHIPYTAIPIYATIYEATDDTRPTAITFTVAEADADRGRDRDRDRARAETETETGHINRSSQPMRAESEAGRFLSAKFPA